MKTTVSVQTDYGVFDVPASVSMLGVDAKPQILAKEGKTLFVIYDVTVGVTQARVVVSTFFTGFIHVSNDRRVGNRTNGYGIRLFREDLKKDPELLARTILEFAKEVETIWV